MTAADRKQQQGATSHWRESARRDWETAQINFQAKRYNWALFITHLVIEKLLKASIVQSEEVPPFSHDLWKLAVLSNLKLPTHFQPWLQEISSFNIEGRYDDEKQSFYKKATKSFATLWLTRCEEIIQWLEQHPQ